METAEAEGPVQHEVSTLACLFLGAFVSPNGANRHCFHGELSIYLPMVNLRNAGETERLRPGGVAMDLPIRQDTGVDRCASLWARHRAFGIVLMRGTLFAIASTFFAIGSHFALAQSKEATLKLSLTGPKGTNYEGHCVISRPDGDEELALSGTTPNEMSFDGDGLKCTLRSSGRLTVEASKDDGNVSRTTTSGGKVTFSIR